MALVGAEMVIELHGVICGREVLGKSFSLKKGDLKVRVDLPESADSFKFAYVSVPRIGDVEPDPRSYSPTSALIMHSETQGTFELRLIRVVVNGEMKLGSEEFDHKIVEHREVHDKALHDFRNTALSVARDFSEWAAIKTKQTWIEPAGEYPQVVSMTELIDIDASAAFGIMLGTGGRLRIIDKNMILTPEVLEAIKDEMFDGRSPGPDQVLLAEAHHIVSGEQVTGPERATLLSAIALEVKIKATLNRLACSSQEGILSLALENPRDVSVSAHGLFLKGVPAVLGEELGSEHAALAKRVQKLFTERNKIAHRGASIEKVDAEKHVLTAEDAFRFLDSLHRK
jgi:hypothetical protein